MLVMYTSLDSQEIESEEEQIAYEQRVAKSYLDSGDFDNAGTAYWFLYFREARKGLGAWRAIRLARYALELAQTADRQAAMAALPGAIAALRRHNRSEKTREEADRLQREFRLAIQDFGEPVYIV